MTKRDLRGAGKRVRRQLDEMGVIEVDSYGKIEAGDQVKVAGMRGEFAFISARLSTEGEILWINVVDARAGRRNVRSFDPTRVTAKRKRRK